MISVIIPTLNEEAEIRHVVSSLENQRGVRCEVIIADGGSTDGTVRIARSIGTPSFRVLVVQSDSGRGQQMNAGFRSSRGEYLLFLHADSQFTERHQLRDALKSLESEEHRRKNKDVAGRFGVGVPRGCPEKAKRYHYWDYRSQLDHRPYITFGDQGLLISRVYFLALGGFSEQFPILEDVDIAERIGTDGRLILLPGKLITSPRRHQREGFVKRGLVNAFILALYDTDREHFARLLGTRLYAHQHKTKPICLDQYCRIISSTVWKDGSVSVVRLWYGIGRFSMRNVWRFFHVVDFLLGLPSTSSGGVTLRIYDRFLAPICHLRVMGLVAGVFLFLGFYILRGICRLGRLIDPSRC